MKLRRARWLFVALVTGGVLVRAHSAAAGPMTGIGEGMRDFDALAGLSIGPTASAAGTLDSHGKADALFSFGMGLTSFDLQDDHHGLLRRTRPLVLKHPVWDLGLELGYQVRSEHLGVRGYFGVGVWLLTLGGSLTVAAPLDSKDPRAAGFGLGPEVVLHLRTSAGNHASVVQPFVRGEIFAVNADQYPTQVVTGVRFLF